MAYSVSSKEYVEVGERVAAWNYAAVERMVEVMDP